MKNVVAIILGGGRGTRLSPLTSIRAKPAVPLAGKYRLIDIPISNCINSEINQIYVLTQFLSVSLHGHIRRTYNFDNFSSGFVELLAAQETASTESDWFQGTADAVRKNLDYIEQRGIDYVLILSGDQLYRMDYQAMIAHHKAAGADATIAALPVTRHAARGFGVMRVGKTGEIDGFLEKPQTDEEIDMVKFDPASVGYDAKKLGDRECLASMGIYVFNRQTLVDALTKTTYKDFGKEVFPAAIRTRKVVPYLFNGYWEDIGTIRSFYEANLELVGRNPRFNFSVPSAPIYSRARFLPSTRIEGAHIANSLIADGCSISKGANIENSIIGLRCIVGPDVTIRDSIIMGADFLEENPSSDRIAMGIGSGTVIESSIVDKNCRIGKNVKIINENKVTESDPDHPLCVIRDGIPVVIKNSTLGDQWRLSDHMKDVS
jgi:glucose-1-phosphate adenylyltransferase